MKAENDKADWEAALAAFKSSLPPIVRCEHEFDGWREFEDGAGGERFCGKCGVGAMGHTLSLGL